MQYGIVMVGCAAEQRSQGINEAYSVLLVLVNQVSLHDKVIFIIGIRTWHEIGCQTEEKFYLSHYRLVLYTVISSETCVLVIPD